MSLQNLRNKAGIYSMFETDVLPLVEKVESTIALSREEARTVDDDMSPPANYWRQLLLTIADGLENYDEEKG
mgnify:CR=1 FL=1